MKMRMELLSDAIFGNGLSIPGGEDISVTCDRQGFPYYRGSTLKGIFREELIQLLILKDHTRTHAIAKANEVLGKSGDDMLDSRKILFSDLTIPESVKQAVLQETGKNPEIVLDVFSHLRTFTALDADGCVKEGSLRMARCVNQGITLEGTIDCGKSLEPLVIETLSMIKAIGTMRNRGFGSVQIKAGGCV